MPMTSIEALSELQQRSLDALKVAQQAQLEALRTARDSAAAAPQLPMARFVADATIAFTYGVMAQQAAIAQQIVRAFSTGSKTAEPPPAAAPAAEIPNAHAPAIGVPRFIDANPSELMMAVMLTADIGVEDLLELDTLELEAPEDKSPVAVAAVTDTSETVDEVGPASEPETVAATHQNGAPQRNGTPHHNGAQADFATALHEPDDTNAAGTAGPVGQLPSVEDVMAATIAPHDPADSYEAVASFVTPRVPSVSGDGESAIKHGTSKKKQKRTS